MAPRICLWRVLIHAVLVTAATGERPRRGYDSAKGSLLEQDQGGGDEEGRAGRPRHHGHSILHKPRLDPEATDTELNKEEESKEAKTEPALLEDTGPKANKPNLEAAGKKHKPVHPLNPGHMKPHLGTGGDKAREFAPEEAAMAPKHKDTPEAPHRAVKSFTSGPVQVALDNGKDGNDNEEEKPADAEDEAAQAKPVEPPEDEVVQAKPVEPAEANEGSGEGKEGSKLKVDGMHKNKAAAKAKDETDEGANDENEGNMDAPLASAKHSTHQSDVAEALEQGGNGDGQEEDTGDQQNGKQKKLPGGVQPREKMGNSDDGEGRPKPPQTESSKNSNKKKGDRGYDANGPALEQEEQREVGEEKDNEADGDDLDSNDNAFNFCSFSGEDGLQKLYASREDNAILLQNSGRRQLVQCKNKLSESCFVRTSTMVQSPAECPSTCVCEQNVTKSALEQGDEVPARMRHWLETACRQDRLGLGPAPRILNLGFGAGAFVTNLQDTCHHSPGALNLVTEPDPVVAAVATKIFGSRADGVFQQDCRQALDERVKGKKLPLECNERFDFVVLNHAAMGDAFPKSCGTNAFARLISTVLVDDGCFIANLDGADDAEEVMNTFNGFFEHSCGNKGIWCTGAAVPNCDKGTVDYGRQRAACPSAIGAAGEWYYRPILIIGGGALTAIALVLAVYSGKLLNQKRSSKSSRHDADSSRRVEKRADGLTVQREEYARRVTEAVRRATPESHEGKHTHTEEGKHGKHAHSEKQAAPPTFGGTGGAHHAQWSPWANSPSSSDSSSTAPQTQRSGAYPYQARS